MTNQEFIESIRLENEEWREVSGWEGYYAVSSFGRVASLYRKPLRKDGTSYSVQPRLLRPNVGKHNGILYCYICFRKNCDGFSVGIHRLVAEAFLPNPNNYSDVDHIDRNGQNNNVTNLRWCTRAMNMANEKTKIVHQKAMRGRVIPSMRKPVVAIKNNRILYSYDCISDSTKDGFSVPMVVRCCKDTNHTHLHKGLVWMYLSDWELLSNQDVNELSPMQ